MTYDYNLRVSPEVAANEGLLIRFLAEEKGLDAKGVNAIRILKRSIDARQRTIYVNLTVRAFVNEIPE